MLPLDDARPHASPFVESEDSVCRSLALLHVLFIVYAKNYRGSEPPAKVSTGMVHLKNNFQYLGSGNCSQLLKLLTCCGTQA